MTKCKLMVYVTMMLIISSFAFGNLIFDEELALYSPTNTPDKGWNGVTVVDNNACTVGGWTNVAGAGCKYENSINVLAQNTVAIQLVHSIDQEVNYTNTSMKAQVFNAYYDSQGADNQIGVGGLWIGHRTACSVVNLCCGQSKSAGVTVDSGVAIAAGTYYNMTWVVSSEGVISLYAEGSNITACAGNTLSEGLNSVSMVTFSASPRFSNMTFFNATTLQDDILVTVTAPPNFKTYGVSELLDNGHNLFINGTQNVEDPSTCGINDTKFTDQGAYDLMDFNFTFKNNTAVPDGEYTVLIFCNKSGTRNGTTTYNFAIDTVIPALKTLYKNNTMVYMLNLSGQFNFSDNLFLHSINVSIDEADVVGIIGLQTANYQLNLSQNITNLTIGRHNLSIRISDGHTAKRLRGDYPFGGGLFDDYLRYEIPGNHYVKTYSKDHTIFDTWSTYRLEDRYVQVFQPASPSSTVTFIEETDQRIYIYEHEKYGQWLVFGDQWKDYVIPGEPDAEVSIVKIDDYNAEVTISGIKNNQDRIELHSFGDINVIHFNYSFYRVNFTYEYDKGIFSNFPFDMGLNVDFNETFFDTTGHDPRALLDWNGVNYTSTRELFDNTQVNYTRELTIGELSPKNTINFKWWFNFSNFSTMIPTDELTQNLTTIVISPCNDSTNFTILNMTYRDELTNELLIATNAYDLTISDGTFFYNQLGSFFGSSSNDLCSNIDPDLTTYNWDLWDTFIVSRPGFVTRVLGINAVAPLLISNNPYTNLSIFLIDTINSSTIKYNWFTSNFELIEGTMRIFQCDVNGTRTLVDSIPVISGEAVANIELLTRVYSYDIIIDGEIFQDLDTFSVCHTESLTSRTFFVDINPSNIASLIGLSNINCDMNLTNNNTVTMTWEDNPEGNGTLESCVEVIRRQVTGDVLIFENCTNATIFTRTLQIPVTGNIYVVTGELRQDGNSVKCTEEIVFPFTSAPGQLFGLFALFGAFILIASLGLIYAGEGVNQLMGAGIGLIASWWLGIFIVDWKIVTGLITFLIIIAIIGRHSRKQ